MGKKIVLHLGCCNESLHRDFSKDIWREIRVDIDKQARVDTIADVRKLPFNDESVDAIYASHLLEHFDYRDRHVVLYEWLRVLKSTAAVYVVVPNIAAPDIVQALKDGNPDKVVYVSAAGPITAAMVIFGQFYPGQYEIHRWGYTEKTLQAFLQEYFIDVQVTNWGFQLVGTGIKHSKISIIK